MIAKYQPSVDLSLYLTEGWVETDKICFRFFKLKPNAFIAAKIENPAVRKSIILFLQR